MKFSGHEAELDPTDLAILDLLQENCKKPLAAIGEKVGLSAPSVVERIHKLEEAGIILAYTALLDSRRLGKDVTAFIGVSIDHPRTIQTFESWARRQDDVHECHHVTGGHTLMVKVKTQSTGSLEQLIDAMREHEGVTRTETMVVLSTHAERSRIVLDVDPSAPPRRGRRNGKRKRQGGEASAP